QGDAAAVRATPHGDPVRIRVRLRQPDLDHGQDVGDLAQADLDLPLGSVLAAVARAEPDEAVARRVDAVAAHRVDPEPAEAAVVVDHHRVRTAALGPAHLAVHQPTVRP